MGMATEVEINPHGGGQIEEFRRVDQSDGELVFSRFQAVEGLVGIVVMDIIGADELNPLPLLFDQAGAVDEHLYPHLLHGIDHMAVVVVAKDTQEAVAAPDVVDKVAEPGHDVFVHPVELGPVVTGEHTEVHLVVADSGHDRFRKPLAPVEV